MNASAQDDARMREVYAQAESAYKVGRIEQTRDVLLQNLSNFQGSLRQNALHLIALTYLVEYDIPHTEQYVTRLLEQNPYYSPSEPGGGACAYDAHHGRDDSDQRCP